MSHAREESRSARESTDGDHACVASEIANIV
jgi:hypothetical protein